MAKILVVDDDAFNLKLAVTVLTQAGHKVFSADGGDAGVALALATMPDLLLMDVQMPGVDGVTALKRLRADARTASLKVIALTALAMKGDRERLLAEGFDGYLEKPIRYKEFLAAVAELLVVKPNESMSATVPATLMQMERPVLDVRVLSAVVGDDPATLDEFLQCFAQSAQASAALLIAASASADLAQVGAQAHKLKSAARSVGALALGDVCAELEAAGKAAQADTIALLLPRFEAEMARVMRLLPGHAFHHPD